MKITIEITRSNPEEKLFNVLGDMVPRLIEHYLRAQAERERRAEERHRAARAPEAKPAAAG